MPFALHFHLLCELEVRVNPELSVRPTVTFLGFPYVEGKPSVAGKESEIKVSK